VLSRERKDTCLALPRLALPCSFALFMLSLYLSIYLSFFLPSLSSSLPFKNFAQVTGGRDGERERERERQAEFQQARPFFLVFSNVSVNKLERLPTPIKRLGRFVFFGWGFFLEFLEQKHILKYVLFSRANKIVRKQKANRFIFYLQVSCNLMKRTKRRTKIDFCYGLFAFFIDFCSGLCYGMFRFMMSNLI
jgi:hypothetical protein